MSHLTLSMQQNIYKPPLEDTVITGRKSSTSSSSRSSSTSPTGNRDQTTSTDRTTSSCPGHVSSDSFRSCSLEADDEEDDEDETLSIGRGVALKIEVPEVNEVNVIFIRYPDDCCPVCISRRCPGCLAWFRGRGFGQKLSKLRRVCYGIVEHRFFETFIIAMILASSLSLVSLSLFVCLSVWLCVSVFLSVCVSLRF